MDDPMRGALRHKRADDLAKALVRIGFKPERAEQLSEIGGLRNLLDACNEEENEDIESALALAAAASMPDGVQVCAGSDDVARLFKPRLAALQHERLYVALVDCRNRVTRIVCVAQGGLVGLSVHPREILKPAIEAGAAGFILVHNHPSGDPTPSMADRELTHRVRQAGEIVGIPLLDHVVVASGGALSV